MRFVALVCLFALSPMVCTPFATAQHTDIEFGYEGGMIVFESEESGFDAAGLFESEFEVVNMDGSQTAEDPGYASNFMKGDETFMVSSGDSIFLNVNQSSTFGTYLTYFNPLSGEFESTTATMTIEDNSPGGTTDLIVSNNGLSGDTSQFLITSDGSEIDTHVDYTLSSGALEGVYGMLLNIESDNMSGDLTDLTSDRYWILFNNGLDKDVFEDAIGNFQPIPEPSTAAVLALAMTGLLRRRR